MAAPARTASKAIGRKPASGKSGARARKRGGSVVWLQGLACGALITLATPTAFLLLVFLFPGLLALVLDRGEGKPVGRPMLLFGLAPTMLPLITLWRDGQTMGEAVHLFMDVGMVGMAWLAASVGWLIGEVAPIIIRWSLERSTAAQAVKLRARRSHYLDLWSIEPESGQPASD